MNSVCVVSVFSSLLTQTVKPVQAVTVGGVNTPQFKTIIPLATPPNVQQIQVPGSRFHYVRLVTATTGNAVQTVNTSTTSNPTTIQPGMNVCAYTHAHTHTLSDKVVCR